MVERSAERILMKEFQVLSQEKSVNIEVGTHGTLFHRSLV